VVFDSNYDYAYLLKSLCKNEYFEYETPRFQFNENFLDLKIANDNYNKKNYLTFILVITIIIALFISLVFSYILYNTFVNVEWIEELLRGEKLDPSEVAANANLPFYKKLIEPFRFLLKKFYDNIIILGKILIFDNKNPLLYLLIIIIYIIVLSVFLLMPLYIILKLTNTTDISPFNFDYEKVLNSVNINKLDAAFNINYINILYIFLFVFIIIIRFAYKLFEGDTEIRNDINIREYFKTNVENMWTSNDTVSYIVFFSLMAIYIVSFYILSNIIYLNKKYDIEESSVDYTNITEQVDKDIKRFTTQYKNHNKSNNENQNINVREGIFNKYIADIIGFNEFNNYDIQYLCVSKLSGVFFTLVIILIVLFVIYYIINMISNKAVATANATNLNIFNYVLIAPIAILAILIFVINATNYYNTYVNYYMIYTPLILYKNYIKDINNIFNPLIVKENSLFIAKNKVCRNIANSIQLIFYNGVFNTNLTTLIENDIEKLNLIDTDDKTKIDITPEFEYIKNCDIEFEKVVYNMLPEYNIEYYLNNKKFKKNIFYDLNNCTLINEDVFKNIVQNIVPFEYVDEINRILTDIYNKVYLSKDKITNKIFYVKNTILENNKEILKMKENIKKYINIANNNVAKENNYYGLDVLVFMNDDKNKIESNFMNNKLGLKNIIATASQYNKDTDSTDNDLIDIIIDEYVNFVIRNLISLSPVFLKLYQGDYQNLLNSVYKPGVSMSYKNEYIKELNDNIKTFFNNLNEILMNNEIRDDKSISKYIISNYNSIHNENIYTKNTLIEHIQLNKNKDEGDALNKIGIIIANIAKTNETITVLNNKLITNEYNNVKYTKTFNDCKLNINKNKNYFFEGDDNFKGVLNKIYNKDNNYILTYEIVHLNNDGNDKTEEIVVNNDIIDVIYKIYDLQLLTLENLNRIYNIKIQNSTLQGDMDDIKKYNKNILGYINIFSQNTLLIDNNYKYYKSNAAIDSDMKYADRSDNDIDIYEQVSKTSLQEAKNVDKLVYILLTSYVIILTITKYIL